MAPIEAKKLKSMIDSGLGYVCGTIGNVPSYGGSTIMIFTQYQNGNLNEDLVSFIKTIVPKNFNIIDTMFGDKTVLYIN